MVPKLHTKESDGKQTVINKKTIIDEINQNIVIYQGAFKVVDSTSVMHFDGRLEYSWYPTPGIIFIGKPLDKELAFWNSIIEVYIDETLIGRGRFTNIFSGDAIEGRLTDATLGDRKKAITKFGFSVPNLRKIEGTVAVTDNGGNFYGRRIFLEDEIFSIEILRLDDEDMNKFNTLSHKGGGYFITNIGEITPKAKHVNIKKLGIYLRCLNYFLSFLNGQRISIICGKGINNESINWVEYSSDRIDSYLAVTSWSPTAVSTDFNDCWRKFIQYWQTDEKLLVYGLHWYFEANRNAGLLEGSLILAQTAIETFCNWIILEKLELIKGNEARSLSTANKMRILLGVLGIEAKIPIELTSLSKIKHPEKSKLPFTDGPEALTEIRNMLTHGSTTKYKTYNDLDISAVREAKQLCLWYVELALLYCFGYQHKYFNRITKKHEYPPYLNRPTSL